MGAFRDDFNSLDLGVWTVRDALGGSTVQATGGNLSVGIASGTEHQNFNAAKNGVGIMRTIANTDFVAICQVTAPTTQIQVIGFIFEQDANDWMRFDLYFNTAALRGFAGHNNNNNTTTSQFNNTVTAGSNFIRVTRTGTTFDFATSTDGVTFTSRANFTRSITLSLLGLYAGNASGAASPAFTGLVNFVDFNDGEITVVPNNAAPTSQEAVLVQSIEIAPNNAAPVSNEAVLHLSIVIVPIDAAPESEEGSLDGVTPPDPGGNEGHMHPHARSGRRFSQGRSRR